MFKALLLAVWHDLSDVKLAEALEDCASRTPQGARETHATAPDSATATTQATRAQVS
ncbi:hypothetical protein [Elioraea sp.]|uniref:hypothetical protein n=1 Tax=Elioraea sp. TaxID=2185103 RepID=UPI003F6EAD93